MDEKSKDITVLLNDWQGGDQQALDKLMTAVYEELRRISHKYLSQERSNHTLGPTGLVNEAYLKLINQNRVNWRSRSHFFCVAAQLMRRVLINHARERRAAKRGGGAIILSLDQVTDAAAKDGINIEELDEAMKKLADIDERKARIVEMKFFAGLKEEELGEVLGISRATVKREWQAARIWLFRFLKTE